MTIELLECYNCASLALGESLNTKTATTECAVWVDFRPICTFSLPRTRPWNALQGYFPGITLEMSMEI
jgi:hypothetical protein|eukprot:7015863-Prymnesium_polylepis.2